LRPVPAPVLLRWMRLVPELIILGLGSESAG
jgi:hypothetical protein